MKRNYLLLNLFVLGIFGVKPVLATEFHVSVYGDNTNLGTAAAPFATIQHAADVARPGDVITVHAGVYRERINPPRGGNSDTERITYQAASGERVEITGSEVAKGWEKVSGDVWKVVFTNSYFGPLNPYSELIHGDWYDGGGRHNHTGAVYLKGDWLTEAVNLDELFKPPASKLWFGQVDEKGTVIWAQFPGANPNRQRVESMFGRPYSIPKTPASTT